MSSILAIVMIAVASASAAQTTDRFPILKPDQLTTDQRKLVETLMSGPRGGDTGPEAVSRMLARGPFNAWVRSPDLGDRLQRVGEYLRYNTSLPLRLNEFAILIAAREWSSQYEWYAHHPLAMKAGLDPKIAADLALGKLPANMKEDEAAVYDFCIQLHRNKKVDDAAYKRTLALFGEKGVMDLIGVTGYYTLVSMTISVAEVGVPPGAQKPLKPLE
jgi:4-carboxymuconolactone decarboxylase